MTEQLGEFQEDARAAAVISKHQFRPRLAVVIGSGSATVREILRYGTSFSELVLIFDGDHGDATMSGLRTELQDEVECVEYSVGDADVLLARHGVAPLDAITTFAEDKIRLTAEIATLLDLPYHSTDCALALTDKAIQRDLLRRAGLGIDFGVAHDANEAAQLVNQLGVACVIKPLTGSGSKHTYAFDRAEGTSETLSKLAMPFPAIVEARLETGSHPCSDQLADVVSVETVFCLGVPVHLGICGRFRLAEPFRETGMTFPSHLPSAMVESAYEMAGRALSALGVKTGATHTELKLTPHGFEVIEINGRLGGDVGRLLELSTGTHAVDLVLQAVCGFDVSAPRPLSMAGVSMLVPPLDATSLASRVPAASLRSVDGVIAIDVHTRPGDAVDYRTGWWAHVACVWYKANDWADLSRTHVTALKMAQTELKWGRG